MSDERLAEIVAGYAGPVASIGRTMPAQKPGRSKQDYGTPPEFLSAVKSYLGIREFAFDLAASPHNAVAESYYTEEDNSLVQPWNPAGGSMWVRHEWNWLNPPFARIAPWVQRAYNQMLYDAQTAVLLPAGVGANWWRDWVHDKARVLLLNGRITFVGETQCYPKDCALLLYGRAVTPGYSVWTWREDIR